MNRKQAIAAGEPFYFTGRPCCRGHIEKRRVVNLTCEECNRENGRHRYSKDPDTARRLGREGYARHSTERKAGVIRWRSKNPDKVKSYSHRTRASRSKAINCPLSLSYAAEIRAIYAGCPAGHEVDHRYPLNHPLCCGLHVPWNLQYLTVEANRAKGNRLP